MTHSLDHESEWWGDCANTWSEEWKQISYATRMGIKVVSDSGHYPAYDLDWKNVLDVGGGPVSMLLKAVHPGPSLGVVDPCQYPSWVHERYRLKNITYAQTRGEDFVASIPYQECWIYNVLQHTEDPEKVIANAKKSAYLLRIFEWIEIPGDEMHPQVLTTKDLEKWCGGKGTVEHGVNIPWDGGDGALCFYGVYENDLEV